VLATAGCGGDGEKPDQPLPAAPDTLQLTSAAIPQAGVVPKRFTCDGEDVSPPLRWARVPSSARELALVMEDRDADRFVHWTLLRIPPGTKGIAAGRMPRGAVETENSFGKRGYGGPCPPEGDSPHRYVFALYALKRPLDLGGDASPDQVREAIAKATLARGTLSARYGRE
jgi:Raf kinase inhibitor-like YbhB/YbcL family protein